MNSNFKNAEWFKENLDRWQANAPPEYEICLPVLTALGFSTSFEYGNDEAPSIGLEIGDECLQVFYGVDVTHHYAPDDERYSLKDCGYTVFDSRTGEYELWESGLEVLARILELLPVDSQPEKADEPKTVKAVPNLIDDFDEWFNAAKFVDVSELTKTEQGGFAYGNSFPVGDSASEETGALVGMWLFPDGLHIVEFEEAFHAPFFDDVIERNRLYHPVISEKTLYDAMHWKSERAVRLMHTYNSRMLMFCAIELYYATYPDDLHARTRRPRRS